MNATFQEPIAGICLTTSLKPAIPSHSLTIPGGITRREGDGHGSYTCTFSVGGKPVTTEYGEGDLLVIYPGSRILRMKRDEGENLVYAQVYPVINAPPDEVYGWLALMNKPRGLAKKKSDRFPTVADMARELRKF